MAQVPQINSCEYDLIVPVPLHPERLRWRGFNQALLLARRVGRSLRAPVDAFSLIRTRNTQPQVELQESDRKSNVQDGFALVQESRLSGKRVLLIDDVYTSGATVGECARVLKQNGAKEVNVLTLARVM
jgi:ComF family protein